MSDINISKFSHELMDKYNFARMTDNDQLWWYNPKKGTWQPNGIVKIEYESENKTSE